MTTLNFASFRPPYSRQPQYLPFVTKLSADWTGKNRWLVAMPGPVMVACMVVYAFHEKGGSAFGASYALLTLAAVVFFGVLIIRTMSRNIVDELYDGGDFILVRSRGVEERIPLSQIESACKAMYSRPPRVTLRLKRPSKFGETIVYSPATRFALYPWAQNSTNDLIDRVEELQSRHVA